MSLAYFPESAAQARLAFGQSLPALQARWPAAELTSRILPQQPEHAIEAILAPASQAQERLLVITTGLHGVEGLIGAAMLQLFIQEFSGQLDPGSTGLYLIHPLNPWGMVHQRRTNFDNIDLNRNFLNGPDGFSPSENYDYQRLKFLLEPTRPVGPIWLERIGFLLRLGWGLLRLGPDRLLAATLEGQYRNPTGLYYGGQKSADEANWLRESLENVAAEYQQLCWIDLHSGYGPSERMTIVDSPLEAAEPYEQQDRFGYQPVVQAEASTFYDINGDMIDAAYAWFGVEKEVGKRFYGTAFEFGTFGDSIGASVRSLRAMVLENQLWFHGAKSDKARDWVQQEFLSLFYPGSADWRRQALDDARQGFAGVLAAEGFLERSFEG